MFRILNTSNPHTATLACIILLIFLPPIFFWRETLGWLTLGDQDTDFWFFPAYKFFSEQIKAGNLPLWTPYFYSGTPFFAQWESGVLDPLNWIYLIETSSRAVTLSLEASFALSLLSTFGYTRRLGFKRRASVLAAVIYALSGFAVGRTLYPGFLHVVALTPLVLYSVETLYQRRRWRDVAAGALIIAWQIFAAHAQPLIYSSLLASAYAVFRLRMADSGLRIDMSHTAIKPAIRNPQSAIRNSLRFLIQFTLMFIGGAALASVQLIPAYEVARLSVRQLWPYELFTLHSLHPISLMTTLFPFFHGSGKTIYQLPYWGVYWHHNEAQIYLGVPALALALAGAVFAWRSRYRIGIFWSVVAIAGVVLSLGKYTGPLSQLLYHLPLISHFRSPNRHWMEVALAVAVLAGYSIDRLLREEERALARCVKTIALVLLSLCCAVGGFVLWRKNLAEAIIRRLPDMDKMPGGFLQAAGAEFYLPMIFAACGCLALFLLVGSQRRGRWYWPLLILSLIDFNLYAAFAPINYPLRPETLIGGAMPVSLAAKQSEQDPIRYHVMLDPVTGEFSPLWFYGHEMATGYDPLLNERYKNFSGIDEAGRSHLETILEARDRTLDILNVRYLFVPPTIFQKPAGAALNDTMRWREVEERSQAEPYREFRIFENLTLLPRAWLVRRAKVAYEGDQLKLIRGEVASTGDRDFDPRTAVLVDHETAAKLDKNLIKNAGDEKFTQVAPVKILKRSARRIQIEAENAEPSVLVLSEIAFPGWKAEVDGKAAELIRVNYDLRGLALTAGKHRIELIYQPRSLKIGAAVSIITSFCLLVVILWEGKRIRNKRKGVNIWQVTSSG
ncbi:MAG: YfhO family protein [Acidobacteria bacterium]|nr:YfhO family protein [Acidobacteriota bacterium]